MHCLIHFTGFVAVRHSALRRVLHNPYCPSRKSLLWPVRDQAQETAKVAFWKDLYYTTKHALSYVIYVMPLVCFSEWVSHIGISVVTVRSYAPAVVATHPCFWLTSIMMSMDSWLHGFFCYQFFMVTIYLGLWVTLQPGFELGLGFDGKDWALFWRVRVPQLKATTRDSVATIEWMSMLLTMKLGLWVTPQLVLYWLQYFSKGAIRSKRWLRGFFSVCILTLCCHVIW